MTDPRPERPSLVPWIVTGGLTSLAVVLVVVGITTDAWWTSGGKLIRTRTGLRTMTVCVLDECHEASVARVLRQAGTGQTYRGLASLTFHGGLLAAIALGCGVVLRGLGITPAVARIAALMNLALLPLGFLALLSFPGKSSALVTLSIGWGYFVLMAGGALGAVVGLSTVERCFGPPQPYLLPSTARGPAISPPRASGPPAEDLEPLPAAPAVPAAHLIRPRPLAASDPRHLASAVAPAAADAAREALRFVARSVTLLDGGMTVIDGRGRQRDVLWSGVERVSVRQLPADPPFSRTVLMDLLPARLAAAPVPPVRILPTTQVNYAFLPGSGVTSIESFRRLGGFVAGLKPGVLEAESEGFFLDGQAPPALATIKQLQEYDARYDR